MNQLERIEDLYRAYVCCRLVSKVELIVQEESVNGRKEQASDRRD